MGIIISIIVLLLLFYNFGQIVLKKEGGDSRLPRQKKSESCYERVLLWWLPPLSKPTLVGWSSFQRTLSSFFAFHNCLQSQSVFPILNVSLSLCSLESIGDFKGIWEFVRYLKRGEPTAAAEQKRRNFCSLPVAGANLVGTFSSFTWRKALREVQRP